MEDNSHMKRASAIFILLLLCIVSITCAKTYKNKNWQLKVESARWQTLNAGPYEVVDTAACAVVLDVQYLGPGELNQQPAIHLQRESVEKLAKGTTSVAIKSPKGMRIRTFFMMPMTSEKLNILFEDLPPIPIYPK
jgi:hypothetical protein